MAVHTGVRIEVREVGGFQGNVGVAHQRKVTKSLPGKREQGERRR